MNKERLIQKLYDYIERKFDLDGTKDYVIEIMNKPKKIEPSPHDKMEKLIGSVRDVCANSIYEMIIKRFNEDY